MSQSLSINNEKRSQKIGFVFTLLIVAIVAVAASSLLFDIKSAWIVQTVCAIVGLIVLLLFKFGGFHYLLIDLRNNQLEIKYYSIFPFGRKFQMIRAQISDLKRIQFRKGFLGIGKGLVLYQNKKGGVAKYPVIRLSALKHSDMTMLKNALIDSIVPQL